MALFYQPELLNGVTQLSEEESRHAVKVLRLGVGDSCSVVDGQGGWYDCCITKAHSKACTFEVLQKRQEPQKGFYIHIAIAPTKNLDRIEWFIEKTVEIGIDEISFLQCKNSERRVLKTERLKKKAVSAMKQSLKASLPVINELQPFNSVIKSIKQSQKYIAYVDFDNPQSLHTTTQPQSDYCVLIGPEGDFSTRELKQALDSGFEEVSLGPSRLRTETAGLVACHTLNLINV